jgi:hypothetical protein
MVPLSSDAVKIDKEADASPVSILKMVGGLKASAACVCILFLVRE